MRFSFLPALGIVAVCPHPGTRAGVLANLFPNDTGKDTPNPANHHGQAARASPLGIFQYPADVPCRPYRWAQWMAGLSFPPPAASSGSASDGAAGLPIEPSVRSAMAALRSRVRTNVALEGQLNGLSAGKGPSPLAGMEGELPEASGSVELSGCVARVAWVAQGRGRFERACTVRSALFVCMWKGVGLMRLKRRRWRCCLPLLTYSHNWSAISLWSLTDFAHTDALGAARSLIFDVFFVRPSVRSFVRAQLSWKELSGAELHQAATAFQDADASKSGSAVEDDEAAAATSGASTTRRDPWERFGARYFKAALKMKNTNGGGKERTVNIQVEV